MPVSAEKAEAAIRAGQEWVFIAPAARHLGMSIETVKLLVRGGRVATLDIPGSKRLISMPDLKRVIAALARPATVPTGPSVGEGS